MSAAGAVNWPSALSRCNGCRSVRCVATKKKSKAATPSIVPNGPAPSRAELLKRLTAAIPQPKCELDHTDGWTLLIATILSAQSTDRTVNTVTPLLFSKWPTPAALAAAPRDEVEEVVHRTGFFRTANVVLGIAYRIASGIVVDTHVTRVSQRLALTTEKNPEKVEKALCALFDQDHWIDIGHRILLHGRYVCLAKNPDCANCPLAEICPSRVGDPLGSWQDRAAHARQHIESGAV